MMPIEFFVPGLPAPQGSKTAFYIKSLGRAILTESSKNLKPWRALVSLAAQNAMGSIPPSKLPVYIGMMFVFARPKNHFNSKGEVRDYAPLHKISAPDVDKLCRGVFDALAGIVFDNDSQGQIEYAKKIYGPQPGVWVKITEVEK